MARATHQSLPWLIGAGLLLTACDEDKPAHVAPIASTLSAPTPKAAHALRFLVDATSSRVWFEMQAPIEKISGEVPASASGEIYLDVDDVTRSTGLVKVDLEKLELYQERRHDAKGAFGERTKNELQNEHARAWFEISDDAPEAVRAANRWVEFRVDRVVNPSVRSLRALSGADRALTADVVGDFRLHGRKNQKTVKAEIRVHFAGDRPESLRVRTLEPLWIGLEEYEIRPREAFGKLAQKTLDALGSKVAKRAPIHVELSARAQ